VTTVGFEGDGGTKARGEGRVGLLWKVEAGESAAGYAPEGRVRRDPALLNFGRKDIVSVCLLKQQGASAVSVYRTLLIVKRTKRDQERCLCSPRSIAEAGSSSDSEAICKAGCCSA
jgi:hypothetical protein